MSTINSAYEYDRDVRIATIKQSSIQSENQSSPTSLSCRAWFKTVWNWVETYFTTVNDPKVSTKVDRQGNVVYWQVFDPAIGRSITFGSELEVRAWLDCRYFR